MENVPNNKDLPFQNDKISPVLIEQELKDSFLDYAMSVIISRALPDVRDGLKPVHRRILYTMHTLGFHYNKPYHKSVRVVGEVLGKYHPHGDQALYGAMVGLVQNFSKRYPLLDGQGNWGSIDGDSPAAMRYTEVRMEKVTQEILADIDKETVDWVPNFDESTVEPVILPSKLPNLLINGSSGIAVGMATDMPPHNLGEVVDACLAYLHDNNISDEKLFELIPGPDFPTAGIICGRAGIVKAYKTGRGNLILRAVIDIEDTKKGKALIVSELPFQVNKSNLIIKIAELVKNKVIEGISNIRDESNKKGIRLVIELKRDEIPELILNQLYQFTSLQTSVSILMLGLLDNRPRVFTLRELIREFILYRQEIVHKRTLYDLKKAQEREHLLAGFIIALQNIDEIVALIKKANDAHEATASLNKRFLFSEEQSKAILEMRLQRLTGLEQEKIANEMMELKQEIVFFKSIIGDKNVLNNEIVKELTNIRASYADKRLTRIEGPINAITEADLIPQEDVVVTLTKKGYVKRVLLETYGVQHRGGKGKMGMASLDDSEDIIQDVFVAKTHDELLFFTNLGRIYSLNVYEVPEAGRMAKGRAVVNLLSLGAGESIVKLLCASDLDNKKVVMVTKQGTIKKTDAQEFAKIRATGIRAITLHENDELVFCDLSSGTDTIILATANGQGIRFKEEEVRTMGRQAAGVIGIRLKKNDYVVGMEIISDNTKDILFATENGFGKRVSVEDFRVAHRAGQGVKTIPTTKRNGKVIGLALVTDNTDILLIDAAGKIIRLPSTEIRTMGRQAAGVRLIRMTEDQKLTSIVAIDKSDMESSPDDSVNKIPTAKIENLEIETEFHSKELEDLEDQNELDELEDQEIEEEQEIEKEIVED